MFAFQVFVVQHVDVCMFSNGKFKNVVALMSSQENCPLGPGGNLRKTYTLKLVKGTTKNWIALEDSYTKTGTSLASTVASSKNGPDEEGNVINHQMCLEDKVIFRNPNHCRKSMKNLVLFFIKNKF